MRSSPSRSIGSAPKLISSSTSSACWFKHASMSGVLSQQKASTSAPRSTNTRAAAGEPAASSPQHSWSGDRRSLLRSFIISGVLKRHNTPNTSARPHRDAA